MATPLGGQFDDWYGGKDSHTHTIVAVCHGHQMTSNFNRASLPMTSNCLDLMEERLHFNHMWTDSFTKSSVKSYAPLFLTPANSANSFACMTVHRHCIYTSFTYYCRFCEVCKLWPCSSLQELVECKLKSLYWWQRSQNKMKYGSLLSVRYQSICSTELNSARQPNRTQIPVQKNAKPDTLEVRS